MRTSVQWKFNGLLAAAILLCVVLTGGSVLYAMNREERIFSDFRLALQAKTNQDAIDDYLTSVEQSVNLIARYAQEDIRVGLLVDGGVAGATGRLDEGYMGRDRGSEGQAKLDEYLSSHVGRVETVFRSVAIHTNGVSAYYYRINPELSGTVDGFLYYKKEQTEFQSKIPTVIADFDPDDVSHVGWYYKPLEAGGPCWMDLYYNANLDLDMISYVVPVYKGSTFVGVAGMDISYSTLVSRIRDVRLYRSGYGFLMNQEGEVVYHPQYEPGERIEELSLVVREKMCAGKKDGGEENPIVLKYTYNGVRRRAVCLHLSNGMILVMTVPASETMEDWYRIVKVILLVSVLLLAGFLSVGTAMVRRVTSPLINLTEAAMQLAQGNYDVTLPEVKDRDEVYVLTESFRRLEKHLKIYIEDLNSRASLDALTRVRNKSGFDAMKKRLDDQIAVSFRDPKGSQPSFSLIMFDCNDLKAINDTYGHECGDIYLRTACRYICKIFAHSPVFRIGGDEFAAILEGDDYENSAYLVSIFRKSMKRLSRRSKEPWRKVSIASGLATYNPVFDRSADDVLRRADKNMYEEKQKMKGRAL